MEPWQSLLDESVQRYVHDHLSSDIRTIALQTSPFEKISSAQLAAQISGLQKVKEKIPLYYQTEKLVYPPTLNLEQSSSEATALFKAKLIREIFGSNVSVIADITGGFGIDAFFMARAAKDLIHVEPDRSLHEIAQHNHTQLDGKNITHVNSTAEAFISSSADFDLIYIDPSRRKDAKKVAGFHDCSPDILRLQAEIFNHCYVLLVKAAPLLDISQALNELTNVKRVFVVAVENECKELLFWCEKDFNDLPSVTAVDLQNTGEQISSFTFTQQQEASATTNYSSPQQFLYEPNAALMKAGAFKTIANTFTLHKLAPSTHLYTSDQLFLNFPGRVFKVEREVKADAKTIRAELPDAKANVVTRNYPLKAEELKKKLKLNDGGEKYVLAFAGEKGRHVVVCARVK